MPAVAQVTKTGPRTYVPVEAITGGQVVEARAAGRIGVEHDDSTSSQVIGAFEATGRFDDVVARRDLAGRPRVVTARRRP